MDLVPRILKICRLILIAQKFLGCGNQIDTAARERMAARQTPQRHPRTAARTMNSHGVSGKIRAGGIKLASARHQRGKKRLIHAQRGEQQARREAYAPGECRGVGTF
jgi:hypothetical protein